MPNPADKSERGFLARRLDWVAGMVFVGILLMLLFPYLHRTTDQQMIRNACQNNLRHVALALQNYQSSNLQFPAPMGRYSERSPISDRVSGFVRLLPFLDQGELHHQIRTESEWGPAYGGQDWNPDYLGWAQPVQVLQCPLVGMADQKKPTASYAFCVGDQARQIHDPDFVRGAFGCGQLRSSSDFKDGASYTIGLAEIFPGIGMPDRARYALHQSQSILERPQRTLQRLISEGNLPRSEVTRGYCWADGAAGGGLVNTILPPNSPSVSVAGPFSADGLYSAASSHRGGINVAMMDGSTRFISDQIDCGQLDHAAPTVAQMKAGLASPYGVWGRLGTANGSEQGLQE